VLRLEAQLVELLEKSRCLPVTHCLATVVMRRFHQDHQVMALVAF
jgi:hypothetical protein